MGVCTRVFLSILVVVSCLQQFRRPTGESAFTLISCPIAIVVGKEIGVAVRVVHNRCPCRVHSIGLNRRIQHFINGRNFAIDTFS